MDVLQTQEPCLSRGPSPGMMVLVSTTGHPPSSRHTNRHRRHPHPHQGCQSSWLRLACPAVALQVCAEVDVLVSCSLVMVSRAVAARLGSLLAPWMMKHWTAMDLVFFLDGSYQ